MVQFGNAKTDEAKKKFLEQMHSIALDHKVRIIDKDAFEYYDTWKNPVVRELAPLMPGAMPGDIAKACAQDVSALDVRRSLQFLERAGFLKQVQENVYVQTEKSVEGSKEGLPLAIRSMHREMGNLAVDSLDLYDLVMALEEEFNVELPADRMNEVEVVSDVVRILKELGVED